MKLKHGRTHVPTSCLNSEYTHTRVGRRRRPEVYGRPPERMLRCVNALRRIHKDTDFKMMKTIALGR